MHIRQTEVAALIAVGEAFVVEAQQMQNRGVEIVDLHRRLGDVHAEVICATMRNSAFDAAASEPHCERIFVMIATGDIPGIAVTALTACQLPDEARFSESFFSNDEIQN